MASLIDQAARMRRFAVMERNNRQKQQQQGQSSSDPQNKTGNEDDDDDMQAAAASMFLLDEEDGANANSIYSFVKRLASDHKMQDPNHFIRLYHPEWDREAFEEHYMWLQSLQQRERDERNDILRQLFISVDMKDMIERLHKQLDVQRRCSHCRALFQKRQSISRYDCYYHPGSLLAGKYSCCNNSTYTPGCSPCIHMCIEQDIDPYTLRPVGSVVRIPIVLLLSGYVRWPPIDDVLHVEYLKNRDSHKGVTGLYDPRHALVTIPVHRMPKRGHGSAQHQHTVAKQRYDSCTKLDLQPRVFAAQDLDTFTFL